jgi:hypothetical protein
MISTSMSVYLGPYDQALLLAAPEPCARGALKGLLGWLEAPRATIRMGRRSRTPCR